MRAVAVTEHKHACSDDAFSQKLFQTCSSRKEEQNKKAPKQSEVMKFAAPGCCVWGLGGLSDSRKTHWQCLAGTSSSLQPLPSYPERSLKCRVSV